LVLDDNGMALMPQLRRTLGELAQREIYYRDKDAAVDSVDHYQKLTIAEAAARVLPEMHYCFAISAAGAQQIVSQTILVDIAS
jgi:hypothetical protein